MGPDAAACTETPAAASNTAIRAGMAERHTTLISHDSFSSFADRCFTGSYDRAGINLSSRARVGANATGGPLSAVLGRTTAGGASRGTAPKVRSDRPHAGEGCPPVRPAVRH